MIIRGAHDHASCPLIKPSAHVLDDYVHKRIFRCANRNINIKFQFPSAPLLGKGGFLNLLTKEDVHLQ